MNGVDSGGLGAVSVGIPEWVLIVAVVVLVAVGVVGIAKVWAMLQG
jgi:hypothetical protein